VTILLLVRAVVLAVPGPFEWVVRFSALFVVFTWFLLLRENPFAIDPKLTATPESTL
jgi:hypothetical protein